MQITDTFSNSASPLPSGGGDANLASELRKQMRRHRSIFLRRTLGFWWFRILLVGFACMVAYLLGPLLANLSIIILLAVCLALLLLPVYIQVIRRLEFGLLSFALGTTALAPKLATVKSADIYPSEVFIGTLFIVLLIQAAFHVRKVSLPPFRAIWPQLGLLVMGIVSNIMVQLFWTHGVPHKLNSNPIVYDEVFGSLVFSFPLMTYCIVTMILAMRERLMVYIQRIFIIAALIVAAVVIYDFRRIGADIYTFRFSEPHIFWMSLRAIAQILALGCLLAYARFLYATTWRQRWLYLVITLICLTCVILSLENSWWLEVGVGLIVMTVIYSRRMIVFYAFLLLPFIPLLKAEITKLQTVKTADAIRLIIWQDSLRVWMKQPVLGVGPGNFWAYDQAFTNLPRALRNCNATGLCVAHNGYLQALGEVGPIGLFFFVAFPVVIIVLSMMLYRRAYLPRKRTRTNVFAILAEAVGFELVDLPAPPKDPKAKKGFWRGVKRAFLDDARSQRHVDRMLALTVLGLTMGSMVADFFAGGFFIPPRQISALTEMPQVVTSWIMWGILMYRDQQWRQARRKAQNTGTKVNIYEVEGAQS